MALFLNLTCTVIASLANFYIEGRIVQYLSANDNGVTSLADVNEVWHEVPYVLQGKAFPIFSNDDTDPDTSHKRRSRLNLALNDQFYKKLRN